MGVRDFPAMQWNGCLENSNGIIFQDHFVVTRRRHNGIGGIRPDLTAPGCAQISRHEEAKNGGRSKYAKNFFEIGTS